LDAEITADGIETPLGVLTMGQIQQGESILGELYEHYLAGQQGSDARSDLVKLSNAYYSAIPHRFGRSKKAVQAAVIDHVGAFAREEELLQLMKDMLRVNGRGRSVLYDPEVEYKYDALNCSIEALDRTDWAFQKIARHVESSQVKTDMIRVQNVFKIRRDEEHQRFRRDLGNEELLFHGSRIQNWVGILSRGLLMPKVVVSMGLNRTDEGWLGHGLYFGNAACTTLYYTTPGRRRTRYLSVARVALGVGKRFRRITYGITQPPKGCGALSISPEIREGVGERGDVLSGAGLMALS